MLDEREVVLDRTHNRDAFRCWRGVGWPFFHRAHHNHGFYTLISMRIVDEELPEAACSARSVFAVGDAAAQCSGGSTCRSRDEDFRMTQRLPPDTLHLEPRRSMSADVLSARGDCRFAVVDEETEKPLDRGRGLGPILVVDDSPEIAMLIAIVLRSDGFAVQTAPSHAEALSKAKLEMPSLVLLDAVLPTPDEHFVAALNEMHGGRVPIIVVSGLPEAAFQNAARRTEAIDAIRKPFDIDDLLVRVRRALDGVRPSYSHSSADLVDGAAVLALVG